MSDPGDEELQRFAACLEEIRKGQLEAIDEVFQRYFARSVRYAKARVHMHESPLIDPEMAVASAIGSLISRVRRGAYPDLDNERDFWNLLARVVERKISKYRRYNYADKRSPGQRLLSVDSLGDSSDAEASKAAPPGAEVSPLAQAIADETLQLLLERLTQEETRDVLLLRMEGFSFVQIAEHMGRSRGWVQRRCEEIRRAAQALLTDDE